MLSELRIENLAVISQAELLLLPGLNVITGETGAGKTILAHAISLIRGARADTGMIRPGAQEASVEAIFSVPGGLFSDLDGQIDVPQGEDLIVRRRISRDGKSRAWLGGRSTTLSVLEQITGRLLAFSAQHEQRSLMMPPKQLEILDRFAGARLVDLREEFATLFDRRAALVAEMERLGQNSEARAREAALLRFQLDEIEKAGLRRGEDAQLQAEHTILINAKEIGDATAALAGLLSGKDSGEDLMVALSGLLKRLNEMAGLDEQLDAITGRLQTAFYELEDLGGAARLYSESVENDPARLLEVEERLAMIAGLKRKYGATIEEVMSYGEKAGHKLSLYDDVSNSMPGLKQQLDALQAEMVDLAQEMRALRRKAATGLAGTVAGHLQDLAFGRSRFEVRVQPIEGDREALSAEACRRDGADEVEFLISPNPGMPPAPIKNSASGGELSRIMLAVKSSAAAVADSATMVFDEIDAGIGGETGWAVGAKLKSLSESAQIICITHLPQIACFAQNLFSVVKESGPDHTATRVFSLNGDELVDQLCRMMGSKPEDTKARKHSLSLLKKAAAATSKAAAAT